MELENKVAIVTGGAVRIGRAISLALAQAGARILVHYSGSAEAARSTVEQITSSGGRAESVSADFTKPVQAARTVVAAALDHFAQVDMLINSAAIFARGSLAATTEPDWDRHFAINLKTPAFLCQEFAARHNPGGAGAIVNIADWRGLHPVPGYLAYTLTKSAVVAMTRLLALELAPAIRVNAVAPGAILPPPGSTPEDLNRMAEQLPLKRHGSVDDVTAAVLFLLRSDFVTGEVLYVTGGQHLPGTSEERTSNA